MVPPIGGAPSGRLIASERIGRLALVYVVRLHARVARPVSHPESDDSVMSRQVKLRVSLVAHFDTDGRGEVVSLAVRIKPDRVVTRG